LESRCDAGNYFLLAVLFLVDDILAHLKILHLSHESLPDWRIEKAAISALNNGHEVAFAGIYPKNYNNKTFSEIYYLVWTAKARLGIPFYWHSVEKQLEKIISQARPDIVHAHNIFSAKMISQFDYPFVYDDHEYWSQLSKMLSEMVDKLFSRHTSAKDLIPSVLIGLPRKIRRILINQHAISLWTKWEKQLVSSVPTITAQGEVAAAELRSRNNSKKVFVVPNFPMKSETQDLAIPYKQTRLSSVYAGSDGLNLQMMPCRNIHGIIKTFTDHNIGPLSIIGWKSKSEHPKIRYTGFLPRREMYEEMYNHCIGLVPFKKHWSHYYMGGANKAYEYAHAGLFVMCTSSFVNISSVLKENCISFDNYDEMASQLEYFRDNMDELYTKRKKIFEFARNNLVWENYEKNIFRAYELC
jgi:hypothetical protein